VDEDPLIQGQHNLRLRTTRSRKKKAVIEGYYGKILQRLPKNTAYVDCVMLKGLPGAHRFLRADPMCATLYCNDPLGSKATQHIQPNCELWEDDGKMYNDPERIVLRTLVEIKASEEKPVTLWARYDLRDIQVCVCVCVCDCREYVRTYAHASSSSSSSPSSPSPSPSSSPSTERQQDQASDGAREDPVELYAKKDARSGEDNCSS